MVCPEYVYSFCTVGFFLIKNRSLITSMSYYDSNLPWFSKFSWLVVISMENLIIRSVLIKFY